MSSYAFQPAASRAHAEPDALFASMSAGYAVEMVEGTVTDVIPEFQLAHIETRDGRGLSLTRRTRGIDLGSLLSGQRVRCVVTLAQPRVLQAQVLA